MTDTGEYVTVTAVDDNLVLVNRRLTDTVNELAQFIHRMALNHHKRAHVPMGYTDPWPRCPLATCRESHSLLERTISGPLPA